LYHHRNIGLLPFRGNSTVITPELSDFHPAFVLVCAIDADRERLGLWGEKYCEKFLKGKGFRRLARNFRCKTGEIDLIMVDGNGSIVFVEVKTRADEDFGPAESSVTTAKKVRMSRAARYFPATHNIENRPFRFDVVAIVLGQGFEKTLLIYAFFLFWQGGCGHWNSQFFMNDPTDHLELISHLS
jgi:putative endonuclease